MTKYYLNLIRVLIFIFCCNTPVSAEEAVVPAAGETQQTSSADASGAVVPESQYPETINPEEEGEPPSTEALTGGDLDSKPTYVSGPKVDVDIHTGSASLSVPIAVPQGRAGIQPSLALSYNSSLKHGISGIGWTMEIGAIMRSTKFGPPQYDIHANDFVGSDTFVLMQNGSTQELVHVGSGIFRPKQEGAFMEIRFVNDAIDYWRVTDKKGIVYIFGQSSLAQEYDPSDGTKIFKWALQRVEDVFGNTMEFVYLRDTGKLYPSEIRYTSGPGGVSHHAFVKFTYDTNRADPRESYMSTYKIQTRWLLKEIRAYIDNGNGVLNESSDYLQRKYVFNYQQENLTRAQKLMSVSMQASDGSALPETRFSYQTSTTPSFQWSSDYHLGTFDNGGFTESYGGGDNGLQLIDINGDGYADLYWNDEMNPSQTRAYINDQNGSYVSTPQWMPPSTMPVSDFPNNDSGMRFADVNGDGRVDLVRNDGNSFRYTYINTGSEFKYVADVYGGQHLWLIPTIGGGGFTEPDGVGDNGVRIGDLNGDGLSDLSWRDGGSQCGSEKGTWINKDNNFVTHPDWVWGGLQNEGGFTENEPGCQGDNGVQLVDINGDGLADIVQADEWQVNQQVALINTGKGFVYDPEWRNWDNLNFDGASQLVDINGDGLPDFIHADYNNSRKLDINTGSGFEQISGVSGPWSVPVMGNGGFTESDGHSDNGVRFGDVNGDGMIDLVWADGPASSGERGVWLNKGVLPDLLVEVDNGNGGITEIEYARSNEFDNTHLPFIIPVVQFVTTRDSFSGDSYTTEYEYEGGLWEGYPKREFRGFSMVKTIDFDGNYSLTYFHQDDTLKGRIERQESYAANGALFAKTVNEYNVETIAAGVDFVYLSRVDNFLFDGDATGKRTASLFFYEEPLQTGGPQYGNLTKSVQLGEVAISGGANIGNDDRTVETLYHNVTTPKRLIGIPKHTLVKDENGVKVRESFFYYDGASSISIAPTLGLLTMKEDWVGDAPLDVNPQSRYEYDIYGNLKKTIDPLNNQTTIQYDFAYFIFPLTTTNAMGHQAVNEYYGVNGVPTDDGNGLRGLWGQLKSSMDPNNQTVKTGYDVFGRPVKTIGPLDSVAFPTSETVYAINSDHIKITSTARLAHGTDKTLTSVEFYDGLGRLIQSKSKSETSGVYVVSGQTAYNNRGLPEYKYIPQFTTEGFNTINPINSTNPRTHIEYDAMGRTVKTTNPDGSWANVIYNDWTTASFNENGHKQESDVDAYGRLVQKREYTGADGRSSHYPSTPLILYSSTSYSYDSEGNLTTVIDAHGNTTTIEYDALGRKRSMSDPDMGVWSYEYDLNGNLKAQADAKLERVEFDYDALNRLEVKRFVNGQQPPVNYTYDDPSVNFSKGRLTRANYQTTHDTEFEYDLMGREVRSVKKIDASQYSVERGYDALSRLVSVKYPNADEVFYSYNAAGQIEVVGDAEVDIPVWEENVIEAPHLHFKLNDNAASTAVVDTGTGGYSAVASANTSTMSVPGLVNQALSFDWDDDEFANCTQALSSIKNDTTGTISVWFKSDAVVVNQPLLTIYNHAQGALENIQLLYQDAWERVAFSIRDGAGAQVISAYSSNFVLPPNNQWHHAAIVQDGNALKIYVNGVEDTIITSATDVGAWFNIVGAQVARCNMGGHEYQDLYMDGEMDDFRYYKRALTPEEIAAIYNNGAGTEAEEVNVSDSGSIAYPPTTYIRDVDYNELGQMTRVEFGSGVVTTYEYDPDNFRLTRLQTLNPTPYTLIQDLNYTYDSVGNILAIVDNVNTASQTFTYDSLNRLTSAAGSYGTKNYEYDEIGNIILKDGKTYYYNECNAGPHAVCRLSDGTLFEYDLNGNMKKKTDPGNVVWVYEYDVENRLKRVKKNNTTVADYTYDGDGGRTKKETPAPRCFLAGSSGGGYSCSLLPIGGGGQPPSDVVKFIGSLFEETGTGSGQRATQYVFLGDQRIVSISNGNVLYFHGDHLGSTNVVTDAVGSAKELIEYEPYGQESRHEKFGTPEEVANYYFTSQYKDDESGLYFYNARYYMPKIGRFISADSLVQASHNPQTLNRYSYANNNPVNNIDPSGHSWKSFWKSFAGAVIGATVGIMTGNPFLGFSAYNAFTVGVNGGSIGAALAGATIGYFGGGAISGAVGSFWGTLGSGALGGAASAGIGGGNAGLGALAGLGGSWSGYAVGAGTGLAGLGTIIGGGVSSEISGGSFGEGALGGLAYNIGFTVGSTIAPGLTPVQNAQVGEGDQVFFAGERLGKGKYNPSFGEKAGGFLFSAGMAILDPGPFNHTGIGLGGDIIADSHPDSVGYNGPGERNIRTFSAFQNEKVAIVKNNASLATSARSVISSSQKANVTFGGLPFGAEGKCFCSQFTKQSYQANSQSGVYGHGPNTQYWFAK